MKRIFAFDPGGTTGWVYADDGQILTYGECNDWIQFCNMLEEMLDQSLIDYIVGESYVISMETVKKTRQYEPLMIIGTAFWLAGKYGVGMDIQSRNIKAFSSDKKLKNLGWYVKGGHARDACRHLLAFMNDHELIDPRRFLDGNG